MSQEMRPYVVRQGDYLVKLAFVHGFDAEEVWNDAKNDEIRGRREDHNILAPGDIVYLPVKERKGLPIVKGATNKYTATVPRVEVALVFQDSEGNPMTKEPCEILGLGSFGQTLRETDGDGQLLLKVPVSTRELTIHFPRKNVTHRVLVGDMDPVDGKSGIQKRLQNIGFWHGGPADDGDGDGDVFMQGALRSFQANSGVDSSGVLDDATRQAILDTHKI
jgi:hypothetical protein